MSIGWVLGSLAAGFVGCVTLGSFCHVKLQHDYKKKLEKAKAGKTVIRVGEKSAEAYTFDSEQKALEYPQEISFIPGLIASDAVETVLVVDGKKKPIEVFNGKEFISIADSQIVEVTVDGEPTYVYIRLVQKQK